MWSPGYSYEFFGGDATYCIIPSEVMELDVSLSTRDALIMRHLWQNQCPAASVLSMPLITHKWVFTLTRWASKKAAKLAIMAGAGPMGLGALTYALHRDVRPSMVVVTDLNQERLDRAASLFPPEEAAKDGIELHFVNTGNFEDPVAELMRISGGTGYDDVLCYAPVGAVVTQSSAILGRDGCLNFFAGPTDNQFSASINFYDVHYNSTHVMEQPAEIPQI